MCLVADLLLKIIVVIIIVWARPVSPIIAYKLLVVWTIRGKLLIKL